VTVTVQAEAGGHSDSLMSHKDEFRAARSCVLRDGDRTIFMPNCLFSSTRLFRLFVAEDTVTFCGNRALLADDMAALRPRIPPAREQVK
jgi:hypothetical protein